MLSVSLAYNFEFQFCYCDSGFIREKQSRFFSHERTRISTDLYKK
jgi:hypothetical protein